jgi:hypothetical protein
VSGRAGWWETGGLIGPRWSGFFFFLSSLFVLRVGCHCGGCVGGGVVARREGGYEWDGWMAYSNGVFFFLVVALDLHGQGKGHVCACLVYLRGWMGILV